jgi:carbonic anhydrase
VITDGIVITCIDPRIDPLAILDLGLPRAVVIRTPGGRVTDETLDAVAVARALFPIEWIVIMHHSDCGLHRSRSTLESLAANAIGRTASLERLPIIEDPATALEQDVELLANSRGVAACLATAGFNWGPNTGELAMCGQRGPRHPMVPGS